MAVNSGSEANGRAGHGSTRRGVAGRIAGSRVVAAPLFATMTQFVPFLTELGAPGAAGEVLIDIAQGSITGSLAVGVPKLAPGGLNVVQASRSAGYVELNGTVQHVLDGESADAFVVIASLDDADDDNLTACLVAATEVNATREVPIDGSMSMSTVELDHVHVHSDHVLVDGCSYSDDTFARAMDHVLNGLALATIGACQSMLQLVIEHATTREQFGVKIGSFQSVKHRVVEMYLAIERGRSVGYLAATALAECDPRSHLWAAAAKTAAGDCHRLCTQEGIQLSGGIGYTWEYDMHLFVRRAVVCDSLFGSSTFHQDRIADLMDL